MAAPITNAERTNTVVMPLRKISTMIAADVSSLAYCMNFTSPKTVYRHTFQVSWAVTREKKKPRQDIGRSSQTRC